jgi:bile acid-coenzyme A ligase
MKEVTRPQAAPRIAGLELLEGTQGVPVSQILKYHADRDPDRPCITMHDRSVTRREFDLATNRLARAYAALGVKQDDYVTIALPNSIEFYAATFAVWKCGATPHPISWRLPLPEAQAIVDLAKPALVVGGPAELQTAVRIPEGFVPDPALSTDALPPLVAAYWKAMSSGGSTGRPKIIVAHKNAVFDPHMEIMGHSPDETFLNMGPLYNNGPFMNSMLGLFTGNHIVVMARFDERQTLELIEHYRVNWIFVVPTMMHRIWRLGAAVYKSFDVSSLHMVLHSGAMCPVWLKQAWIDWLGPDRILEAYGGTEAQGTTTISGREWLEHPGSVGRARPGTRVQILDPEGRELPAGEVGEIFFLPDNSDEKTYHYIGAERREIGAAGSVGDMGYVDGEGWLYIADRRTDMIVSGGANIFPAEVEAALDSHPAIKSSIAIGLPDVDMGATVHAIVQLDPLVSPRPSIEDIKAYLKTRIVTYKLPRSFEFVTESLRDDAGKARRSQLREARLPLRAAGKI